MDLKPQDIPVFILAGGLGTRISEESQLKPKPMIEIGGVPILVHLMRYYYYFGFNDFVICAGYKASLIKEFFLHYSVEMNHLEIDHREDPHKEPSIFGSNVKQEKWRVRVIDTGLNTMTGARVARAYDEAGLNKTDNSLFAVTYGDGLCSLDMKDQLRFHVEHGKVGTLLATPSISRFGELDLAQSGIIQQFLEKPQETASLINGGFFLFKNQFRNYLSTDADCILERKPLETLARDGELVAYKHKGFWQCMDTLRDKIKLEKIWISQDIPWLRDSSKSGQL